MPVASTALEAVGRMALAIGMAIFMGLAFEGVYKRAARGSPGGIRTFPTLALLGGVLYGLQPTTLLPFLVGLAAIALWLYAHLRAVSAAEPSLMIPAANLLAYTFGPIALTAPSWVVVAIAVLAVLLLEGRESLHRLVQQVPQDEVFTLGKFLILVGVVLPLLPNHPVVAWTPITPFKVWLALVAMSSLSYASYLLRRYLPAHSHPFLPALLGGMYSSTVTTVALAREQRETPRVELSVGIVIATAIMYLRLAAVIAFFDLTLAVVLLPALLALAALGAAFAAWEWHQRGDALAPGVGPTKLTVINPLQLGAALSFALSFVVVAILSSLVRSHFGERGVLALAGIAGVTDVDPFVMTLAQGGVGGMSVHGLGAAVLIAASSNDLLKASYALLFGGVRACRRAALTLLALGVTGLVLALLYLR